MGLLRRDPDERLIGRRRAVARWPAMPASSTPDARRRRSDAPFVGRDRQLRRVARRLGGRDGQRGGRVGLRPVRHRQERAGAALSRSSSGARDDVVVLAGRCYENESVPYKALDGVIDDLSRYLESIPRVSDADERCCRPSAGADARLSRCCCRSTPIADAAPPPAIARASIRFASGGARSRRLRELLGRLAARRPLVIWIDDLQWADADSVVLLEELLRPPARARDAHAAVRSAAKRSAAKPFLRALLERAGRTRRGRRCRSSR